MSLGEMPEDFLTVIKPRREYARTRWDRLRLTGAVTALQRAQRIPIPLRDMIALVTGLTAIGVLLGAHARGLF